MSDFHDLDEQLARAEVQMERLRSMNDSEFVKTIAQWEAGKDEMLTLNSMIAFIDLQIGLRTLKRLCV